MLLGSKDTLAIQHERASSTSELRQIHFCLWAAGHRIGVFEETAILGTIQAQFDGALAFNGKRAVPEITSISPEAIFHHLHRRLYGDENHDDDPHGTRFEACNLSGLGVYAFDGLFVFLIDFHDRQLLVWRASNGGNVFHAWLDAAAFDQLAKEYATFFEGEARADWR